jgi:hypothetical protein
MQMHKAERGKGFKIQDVGVHVEGECGVYDVSGVQTPTAANFLQKIPVAR